MWLLETVRYSFTRFDNELSDYVIYYWSLANFAFGNIYILLIITGTCVPPNGFGRFDIKFIFFSVCALLSIAMINFRHEFDLVKMSDGSSRISNYIFIALAYAYSFAISYMHIDDIMYKGC